MPYHLSPNEYEALIHTTGPDRYKYTLKRVADWEEVWSLANEDCWVLQGGEGGTEMVPIWPHPRFAELCATGHWDGCAPRLIKLEDWCNKWLPGLSRDGRMLSVFPVPGASGTRGPVVSPDRFTDDLQEQLDMIE